MSFPAMNGSRSPVAGRLKGKTVRSSATFFAQSRLAKLRSRPKKAEDASPAAIGKLVDLPRSTLGSVDFETVYAALTLATQAARCAPAPGLDR